MNESSLVQNSKLLATLQYLVTFLQKAMYFKLSEIFTFGSMGKTLAGMI